MMKKDKRTERNTRKDHKKGVRRRKHSEPQNDPIHRCSPWRLFAVANPSLIGAILGCLSWRRIWPRGARDCPNSFSFSFCFSVICLHDKTCLFAIVAVGRFTAKENFKLHKTQHAGQITILPFNFSFMGWKMM